MLKVSQPFKNIIEVIAPDFETLAFTFLRAQEYSEGVLYYRQVFDHESFKENWCKTYGLKEFDYVNKWNGYNISGKTFFQWTEETERLSSLTQLESLLIDKITELYPRSNWNEIYIYGVSDSSDEAELETVRKHELAHALYNLFPKYKKKCNSYIKELPKEYVIAAERELLKRGYRREVFRGEIQAFLSTEDVREGVLGVDTLGQHKKQLNYFIRFGEYFQSFINSGILNQ